MDATWFEGIRNVTAFSDPARICAAQIQTETEVQKLIQQIAALKRFANTLVAVSRLPEELLAETFIYLRDTASDDSLRGVEMPVNISQVCHHWRSTALACPRLWSHLNLRNDRWTEEKLRRSQNAVLEVHFDSHVKCSDAS